MSDDPRVRAVPLLGIVLLALATYANATVNDFALDDGYLIEANPRITTLGNLPELFVTDLFGGGYAAAMYYRPLVPTSFALEYALVGATPFLFHLTNILLHAGVCALVYLLALRLFSSTRLALVAAALFAVHPVHSEAVAAISGRGDLLAALFVLAAGLTYAGGGTRLGVRRSVVVLACYALALLSKESSVVAIALFPLIDFVRHEERVSPLVTARTLLRERLWLWIGLAAVTLAFLLVRQIVAASDIAVSALGFMGNRHAADASLAVKLATCAKVLGIYLRLLVLPLELSADYDYNQVPLARSWLESASFVPLLATLALFAAAFRSYQGHAPIFFGSTFLLIFLLPIALLLPFLQIPLAERYLYLPSLGFCLMVGALVARVPARRWTPVAAALVLLVILPAAARTIVRNRDWRDDDTLFAATVESAPNSSKAQANRAATLAIRADRELRAGDTEQARQLFREAAQHYERSIAIEPFAGPVRANFAQCLAALGSYDLAEAEFAAAASLGHAEALVLLYRVLVDQSRQHASTSPMRALGFARRARDLFETRIRPVSPVVESGRLAQELDRLENELRAALTAPEASP